MPAKPSPRKRSEVVTILHDRLQNTRDLAQAKGMPRDAPWTVPVVQPEVSEFGGAAAVRAAARTAARRLGIRIHTYATCRADEAREQMIVIGNRGDLPLRRPPMGADPRWPAFALDVAAGPGDECDCGQGPCLSAGLTWASQEGWLITEWYSLTPATDLRTLPPELRSRDPEALFAARRSYEPFDDRVLDLSHFQDGQVPLGPLGEVQVYATNPRGHYSGRSHGVGCRYAEEIGERHEILPLAEFLPLLPQPAEPSSDGYGSLAEIFEEMMYQDRSDERWCGSCGGYAVRRFTPEQCAYYRRLRALYLASL